MTRVGLALAEHWQSVPTGDGWAFQVKLDGYRAVFGKDQDGAVFVRYRSGQDVAHAYPEVVAALHELPCRSCVMDGELVVLDAEGRPDIRRLRKHRAHLNRLLNIRHAAKVHPATAFAFDILDLNGEDMRQRPWRERDAFVQALVAPGQRAMRHLDHVLGQGTGFFEVVKARGLEGVIARRVDAPYVVGRSPNIVKIYAAAGRTDWEARKVA